MTSTTGLSTSKVLYQRPARPRLLSNNDDPFSFRADPNRGTSITLMRITSDTTAFGREQCRAMVEQCEIQLLSRMGSSLDGSTARHRMCPAVW